MNHLSNGYNHGTSVQRGFLLIEFLVSFVIFTGLVVTLARYQWHICAWREETKRRFIATSCAQSVLEQTIATRMLPKKKEIDGIEIITTLTPSSPLQHTSFENCTMKTTRFRLIRVQATWQSPLGEQRSYKLVSGCVL